MHFTDKIPHDSVIALGDVHGRIDLLNLFLDWVQGSNARVILLGDLIDRAQNPGDDVRVLERVHDLIQDPESWGLASFISLRGNHETMLLNALSDRSRVRLWINNGGDADNLHKLAKHEHWLSDLPYYVTVGDTLFSHAGVVPGENPGGWMHSERDREDFVWNRGSFLQVGPQFEAWNPTLKKVVFGHTPKSALPYVIPDGVCCDTGAYTTGVLTAYNATYNTFNQFEIE